MPENDLEDKMSTTLVAKQSGCAQEPLRYLTRIGLWGDRRDWLRRYLPLLALAQSMYGLVTQAINVVQTWGKLELAAEYCVTLLLMLMTLVKTGCLVFNAGMIQEIVTALDAMGDSHSRNGDFNQIMVGTRTWYNKFARIGHDVCSSTLVVVIIGLVLDNYSMREIPHRRWYPFDIKPSPVYELTLLPFMVLAFYDIYVILLFDLLVLSLLKEVIGEFQVLQNRLQNIDFSIKTKPFPPLKHTKTNQTQLSHINFWKKPRDEVALEKGVHASLKQHKNNFVRVSITPSKEKIRTNTTKSDSPEQRLAACVYQHQVLITLIAKLEAAFQPALVVHLVCNFFAGLTLAIVTTKSDRLDMKMVNMFIIGFDCVGEFALYCYFCTQLMRESSLVGEALYACDWWNAGAGFKSSMRIVQLRINRPLIIRAAAIFPMSMETFTQVMQMAYNMYGLMITTN